MEALIIKNFDGSFLNINFILFVIQIIFLYFITQYVSKHIVRVTNIIFYYIRLRKSDTFKIGTNLTLDISGTELFTGEIVKITLTRVLIKGDLRSNFSRFQSSLNNRIASVKISNLLEKEIIING